MAQQNAVKQSAYSIQMVSQSTNCHSLMRMTQRTETLSSNERMRGICRHELFRNAFNPVSSLHVLTPRLTQLSAAFQWQAPAGARERVHWLYLARSYRFVRSVYSLASLNIFEKPNSLPRQCILESNSQQHLNPASILPVQ